MYPATRAYSDVCGPAGFSIVFLSAAMNRAYVVMAYIVMAYVVMA